MKPGDKVILNETMDELEAGLTGIVVNHQDNFDSERQCFSEKKTPVLCVRFDGRESYSVGRYINGVYTLVIDKCRLALLLLLFFFCQCSAPNSIERYTYVRPAWTHSRGLTQCPSYQSNKPVKRGYYWRIQQFNREFSKSN